MHRPHVDFLAFTPFILPLCSVVAQPVQIAGFVLAGTPSLREEGIG